MQAMFVLLIVVGLVLMLYGGLVGRKMPMMGGTIKLPMGVEITSVGIALPALIIGAILLVIGGGFLMLGYAGNARDALFPRVPVGSQPSAAPSSGAPVGSQPSAPSSGAPVGSQPSAAPSSGAPVGPQPSAPPSGAPGAPVDPGVPAPAVPYGEILFPQSGQRIPSTFTAQGKLSGIPARNHIWLIIRIGNLMWPKSSEIVPVDQHWNALVKEDGTPKEFSLVLAMVGPTGNNEIEDWLRRGREGGGFPGLRHISEMMQLAEIGGLSLE
jgi:hypothetical protein